LNVLDISVAVVRNRPLGLKWLRLNSFPLTWSWHDGQLESKMNTWFPVQCQF